MMLMRGVATMTVHGLGLRGLGGWLAVMAHTAQQGYRSSTISIFAHRTLTLTLARLEAGDTLMVLTLVLVTSLSLLF